MSFAFPTHLHLSVIQAAATMSLYSEDGISKTSESVSLVLRATRGADIVLSTGELLSDVDIHFTLSTKWRTAQELDEDLTNEDVGFLVHNEGTRGEPSVHGGALLSSTTVITALLSTGTNGAITLVLPSVPVARSGSTLFAWGRNRPNMLRISHLEVSVLRSDGVSS